MNNRNYIFIGIIALALVIIFVLAYFAFWNNGEQTVNDNYTDNVIEVINNPINKITDDFGDIIIDDDYIISYGGDTEQGTFFITIGAEPIIEVSKRAEQVLLEKLQVSEIEACELYVILNVPSVLDDNLAQYDFGLSFCPGRPHIEDVPRSENQPTPYSE